MRGKSVLANAGIDVLSDGRPLLLVLSLKIILHYIAIPFTREKRKGLPDFLEGTQR